MTRPVLLDAFCGAGGASVGYSRAGFEVVGVDIEPQENYPFEFHQGDALEFLATADMSRFSAAAASPPCQWSSNITRGTNAHRRELHTDLIPATRQALARTGLPTIIENVQGAAVRRDLTLCGEMFGLDVIRHRYFELDGWSAIQPAHVKHRGKVRGWRHGKYFDGPYFAVYGEGGGKGSIEEWKRAMGIDWMTERREIAEAIPPRFALYVGTQLAAYLERQTAA